MTDKNIPAFPQWKQHFTGDAIGCSGGMTLRDWFAGMALQAAWEARYNGCYEGDDNDMAECAYQIADAMMKARGE